MKLLTIIPLFFCSSLSHANERDQLSLSTTLENATSPDDNVRQHAFYIFNSAHHLLRQWGNTLSPNGFSYARATVPQNTNLYHARLNAEAPPSPEWLSFDPEMAYSITLGLCSVFMRTYKTTRTLNLLYLDGNAGSLTNTGTLDSQDILLYGYVKPRDGRYRFDEVERANRLCTWGEKYGLDGFIRQNSGFELIKCNFDDGLKLVSNVNVTRWFGDIEGPNVTAWGRPCGKRGSGNPASGTLKSEHPVPSSNPWPRTTPNVPHYPSDQWRPSPYTDYVSFEWARSASALYHGIGEPRVNVDSAFVTAYGREGLGLWSDKTIFHRLTNITNFVARELSNEVGDLFSPTRQTSGIDWRSLTDQMVLRYGERLLELREYLKSASSDSIYRAQMLISSLIEPHYDFDADHTTNLDACTNTYTPLVISSRPSSEIKILHAIEHVQRSICEVVLFVNHILFRSLKQPLEHNDHIALAATQVTNLMEKLDWKMWIDCEEKCGIGEICLITLWPLSGLDLTLPPTPRCANASNWR